MKSCAGCLNCKTKNKALRAQLAQTIAKPNADDPFAAQKAKAERVAWHQPD